MEKIAIIIQEMKKIHTSAVAKIEKTCFAIPWSEKSFLEELDNEIAIYYVACCFNKVVGYIGMWEIGNEGHITNIAVHPAYRRKRIGSKLLEAVIERAKVRAICALTLEVRVSNKIAIDFYKKYGFKIEGKRKKYYADNKEDAYIMWRFRD